MVEMEECCYLVEIKQRGELNDPMVLAKKERGLEYCKLASAWCIANHKKPWKYMFIPHDAITDTSNFDLFLAHFVVENA